MFLIRKSLDSESSPQVLALGGRLVTSSAKPRPELFNLEAFWVGFQAVSKLVPLLVDDFSSGERILIIVQAGVA